MIFSQKATGWTLYLSRPGRGLVLGRVGHREHPDGLGHLAHLQRVGGAVPGKLHGQGLKFGDGTGVLNVHDVDLGGLAGLGDHHVLRRDLHHQGDAAEDARRAGLQEREAGQDGTGWTAGNGHAELVDSANRLGLLDTHLKMP